MLLKTLWVTVLLCSLQQFLYSQIGGYTLNGGIHYKYWHYRQKLISDFLVIGNEDPLTCQFTKGTSKFGGSGLSIPACWRYETSDPTLNHYNWGDGTGELGWYIGVLATELRLLYNYNQDYTSTQYELYCALKAYERLDRSCEAIAYPFTSTTRCNTINGMFVRDDVDATLMDQHIAFKAKMNSWDSDLEYAQNQGANAYPSQDQMANLFLGFSLVKRCLNEFYRGRVSPRNYNGTDLVDLATSYTDQIANRMKDHSWIGHFDNDGEEGYKNNAGLYDEGNAYGFAWCANHITGNSKYTDAFCGALFCPDNWQIQQRWLYKPLAFNHVYYDLGHDYSIALTLCYAAVGQTAWDDDIFASIKSFGQGYNMNIYPLLYQYLYNSGSYIGDDLKFTLLQYINTAPYQGPMFKPTSTIPVGTGVQSGVYTGVPGWRADNKFTRCLDAENGSSGTGKGDYNGLDFMLLYNLFWLINPDPSIVYTRYVNGNILDTNNDIKRSGSVYRDAPIHFASKIMPDPNTGNSSVHMKSSFEINLLEGFETVNNTDILLEARPMTTNYLDPFRDITNDDTSNGFDFQINGETTLCNSISATFYVTCNEPEAITYTWQVQNGSVVNTYSGTYININTIPGHTYLITCTASVNNMANILNGTCSKTKQITVQDQYPGQGNCTVH